MGFEKNYYSQRGEDIIIHNIIKNFYHKDTVAYLDIGCGDPIRHSNTYLLYADGSRGVCVDPNSNYNYKWASIRRNDVFINKVVSDMDKETDYYIYENELLNTTSKIQMEYLRKVFDIVPLEICSKCTISSRTLLDEFYRLFPTLDVISIDVEGGEKCLLESLLNYDKSKLPLVICAEVVDFATGLPDTKNDLDDFFIQYDYSLFATTFVNNIYYKRI